ncbi:hypothetical protein GIB67_028408 [Kingdonia uniflora]|uniref:Uncharacterized protein n=1 Tax=Kingdonia uniflora TaxID=39325 RepID=A0A7J7MHZ6_9MAGN|nr:hypothetical protein GIB67_028408 [Kingdonia uniflora]
MAMSTSPSLPTPTSSRKPLVIARCKSPTVSHPTTVHAPSKNGHTSRREFTTLVAGLLAPTLLIPVYSASAASDEEYIKETEEVISKVKATISMEKNDPNVATAVSDLRETSNSWVAKYRREKSLLSRVSFRDMYSALNAVSGHYISFGPTSQIPAKRRQRILEEVETAEKNLLRGR